MKVLTFNKKEEAEDYAKNFKNYKVVEYTDGDDNYFPNLSTNI